MKKIRCFYGLARADFLERIRRGSFLVVIAFTIYATYWMVPPSDSGILTVSAEGLRGRYNSPWVGTMFGMVVVMVLPLLGFFLVKNAVSRDRETRVGEILSATPLSRLHYTLGKCLSNLTLLTTILVITTCVAVVMQIVRGEEPAVDFLALASPIWIMGLPVMVLVAATAVFFESVSFLRGGFGNIVYFVIWLVLLTSVYFNVMRDKSGMIQPHHDLAGVTPSLAAIQQMVKPRNPDFDGLLSIGQWKGRKEQPLYYKGITWSGNILAGRLGWCGVGLLIISLAAVFFDRFDSEQSRIRGPGPFTRLREKIGSWTSGSERFSAEQATDLPGKVEALTSLNRPSGTGFQGVLLAEFRLMIKGQTWWWYAVTAAFIATGLSKNPADGVTSVLPLALLWPVLLLSSMGAREALHAVDLLAFTSPHPIRRQLPACWIAGVAVALVPASGVVIRLLISGSWDHLTALVGIALFISALALTLGTWSRNSRLFEMVYLILWYVGLSGAEAFDLVGNPGQGPGFVGPINYLLLSLVLIALAMVGRWRVLRI